MFQGQKPEILAKADVHRSAEEKQEDLTTLMQAREQEKQEKIEKLRKMGSSR